MVNQNKMSQKIWRQFKNYFIAYIGLGILASFLGSLNIYFFQKMLDSLTRQSSLFVLFVYLGTLFIVPLLNYASEYPRNQLYHGIYYFLKREVLGKVSRIDYQTFIGYTSGELLQKIEVGSSSGRECAVDFWSRLLRELIPDSLFNLGFIALIDVRLLDFILFGYVGIFALTRFLLGFLERLKQTTLVNEEQLNAVLTRGISAMVTFRISGKFQNEIKRYEQLSGEITKNLTRMTLIHELFFTIFALLVALIKVAVVVLFFTHHLSLSLGGLVALVAYIDKIYNPVAIFNVIFVQYRLNKLSFERLENFYQERDDAGLSVQAREINEIAKLSLTDVRLSIGEKLVLRDLSLSFCSGKIYGIVGASGAGKSTLLKLVLGLLKTDTGEIKVNDIKLSELNLKDLYRHVFYISQESPIFEGTLRENILMGKKAPDDQVVSALTRCQLNHFYKNLPEGLETTIGENGENLSGGERQRLAFSRLFFSDAELIVFDEATSALDVKTEENLLSEIKPLLKNKLVLMITHHASNLMMVDEQIQIKKVY